MDLSSFGVDTKKKAPEEIVDKKLDWDVESIQSDFTYEEVERYLPWFLKYKVEKFEDLVETPELKKIKEYFDKFKPGKSLLLYGAPGCGKTTTLNLVGEYYDYEIFELNASDSRSKKAIDQSVGEVIVQQSLFGKKKMILIDEVDGAAGREDRGGVAELVKMVKESKYPIVFTANDVESDKLKALKKVATFIDFENSSHATLKGIAIKIFKREGIGYDEKELDSFIEERSITDIRGFINDLQASVYESKFSAQDNLEIRDYKKKIEMLLDKIYFSYPEDSYKSTFNTDVNLDDLILFLEENTPTVETSAKGVAMQFNEIAKADVFRGRIMRWQYWRYLAYVNFYLTFAVSAFKESPKKIAYKKNQRILKKWIYGNKVNSLRVRTRAEKEKGEELKFVERLAKKYVRSANRTRKDDLFYFSFIFQRDEEFRREMSKELGIGDDVEKSLMEM